MQDLTFTVKVQAQLAENLQAQQVLGEAALKETREKLEKLEEAAQPVTISVPILQRDHYFEQPQAQGFEFLQVQQGAALPADFQNCETGSIAAPDSVSELLDSSEETFVDPGPVPKSPDTSPQVKRKQPAPQQLEQQGPAVQEDPVNTPGDLCPGGKKQPALQFLDQEGGNRPLEDLHPGKRREGQPVCLESETTAKPSEDRQRRGRKKRQSVPQEPKPEKDARPVEDLHPGDRRQPTPPVLEQGERDQPSEDPHLRERGERRPESSESGQLPDLQKICNQEEESRGIQFL